MKTSLKRIVLLFLAMGFMALVGAGCQTTKGFGRDVEHVGDKIQGHDH
jgi:predicted small secreted protein